MSDRPYILDSSALLAILFDEPGAGLVLDVLHRSRISAVNLSEVIAKLHESGVDEEIIEFQLARFNLQIVAFDRHHAVASELLRRSTRSAGLSLGDRACIALTTALGGIALTTDRAWTRIDVPVEIRLLRP